MFWDIKILRTWFSTIYRFKRSKESSDFQKINSCNTREIGNIQNEF